MAMVPYMAAGYAMDRMMGGNGTTGLAIGTGVGGFGTGAFAGALGSGTAGAATAGAAGSTSMMSTLAAEGALAGAGAGAGAGVGTGATMGASSIANPMAGMSPVAEFGTVNPLTTGGFNESISPFTPQGSEFGVAGSTNIFGSPISNQTVNSALTQDKGLLNRAIEDSYIQDGFDFVNDGYENMSAMDTINTGMLGSQAIDTLTQQPEPFAGMNIGKVAQRAEQELDPDKDKLLKIRRA